MNIQDSVAIVTGASAGIGEAVAKQLGEAGAKVVLAARSEAKLKEIAAQIPGSLVVLTDMRKPDDIKALVQTANDKFGRVDILINNAGQGMRASVESTNIDDYRSIFELNVIAPLIAMQEVIPLMRKQGGGVILNISGMVSKLYFPNLAAYSSSRYALNCISLTARAELEEDNIAVSVFLPKMTATDFGQNIKSGDTYDSRSGRPGMTADTVEDVAKAILEQLQSEEAEVTRS